MGNRRWNYPFKRLKLCIRHSISKWILHFHVPDPTLGTWDGAVNKCPRGAQGPATDQTRTSDARMEEAEQREQEPIQVQRRSGCDGPGEPALAPSRSFPPALLRHQAHCESQLRIFHWLKNRKWEQYADKKTSKASSWLLWIYYSVSGLPVKWRLL